ncbi:MAG: hypothetical protein KKH51_01935 [Actinobacteria bacterium]|nr:hypothetical protein [Actinomycetota bacterium]
MSFIWATRGKTWGFRFLRDGGFIDPLPEYDKAFSQMDDEPDAWARVGNVVALRFPDPEHRRDAAGRTIPHEFVLFGTLAKKVRSTDDGLAAIWPLVADEYGRLYN